MTKNKEPFNGSLLKCGGTQSLFFPPREYLFEFFRDKMFVLQILFLSLRPK